MEIRGKRALITGASSGIGADLARELAGAGADLVLSARRVAELEDLAAEVRKSGARVDVVPGDLGTPAGADALAQAAGRVDILVNNAGVDLMGKPWKEGLADKGDRLFQVNVLSPLRLTNKLLGAMVERDQGAVVFVSSVSAWSPFPGGGYYAASKAALARYAETTRIDLKGTGVHVLAVYPGPIFTPMLDKALATESGRKFFNRLPKGTSPELARRIALALRRDEDSIVYPGAYMASVWFSGLTRWFVGKTAPPVRKKPASETAGSKPPGSPG